MGVRAIPDRMSTVNKAHSRQGWGVCVKTESGTQEFPVSSAVGAA